MSPLFALVLVASMLVPLRALAHPCEAPPPHIKIHGHRAQRIADLTGIFNAVQHGESVPEDDQAICADLVWSEDCPASPGFIVEHEFPPHSHLVTAAPGGGFWLSDMLGDVGFRECGTETNYSVTALSDRHLLVTNHVRFHILNVGDDDETSCEYLEGNDIYAHWLFDRISGVVLASFDSHGDDDVSIEKDVLVVDVEGKPTTFPLADIAACAAWSERKHGALARARVDEGRRQTRQKDYTAAIDSFSKAITYAPTLATAWSGLGYAELLSGQYERANESFSEALTLDQDKRFQGAVWFNIGLTAEKRNNTTWAVVAFTRAHALKPSRAAAQKLTEHRKKTK